MDRLVEYCYGVKGIYLFCDENGKQAEMVSR